MPHHRECRALIDECAAYGCSGKSNIKCTPVKIPRKKPRRKWKLPEGIARLVGMIKNAFVEVKR